MKSILKPSASVTPILLLSIGVLCVSTAGIIAQRALREAAPLAVAAWRLGIAAAIFASTEEFRKRPVARVRPRLSRIERIRMIAAGIFVALHFLLWFTSIQYIGVSISTLLVSTTPFWTALVGLIFLHRRPTPQFWAGLFIAFVGVLMVVGAKDTHHPSALLGDFLAVFSAMTMAGYFLCVEGLQHLPSGRLITWCYSSAAVVLWSALVFENGVDFSYTAPVWGALLLLALVPQVLGHTLLTVSLRSFASHTIALSTLAEPVVTAALAVILLHESLTSVQIFGGIVVLGSVWLVLSKTDLRPIGDEL